MTINYPKVSQSIKKIPLRTIRYHKPQCNTIEYHKVQLNTLKYHRIPVITITRHDLLLSTIMYTKVTQKYDKVVNLL